MTDYAGEAEELIGGGESLFLGPGLLLLLGGSDGDDLGYGEGTVLPPYTPIVASLTGASAKWRAAVGSWYTRFWPVLGPDMHSWAPYSMPFMAGPEVTLGSTATPEEIVAVKKQILKWKSPIAYPVKVILDFETVDGRVVLLGETGLAMPFTSPDFDGDAPYCTWRIGKLMNDTLGNMPFVAGGYFVETIDA